MIKSLVLYGFVAFWSQFAFAQAANPLEQLSANNVAAVESFYSSLQSKFERGEASEYDLLDAYKVFYQREDRYRSHLDRWINAYPKSSSAYLARGVYYRKLGEAARGTDYISQVPSENVAYMEQMFEISKKDLKRSLKLNPKSYLSILHLLNIAQFQGDYKAADKYLALANSVSPSNFLVRARYLIQLAPKWGGSYRSMDKFINECRTQGLAQDKIDMLNAIKADDQGSAAEERGKSEFARTEFKKALILSQGADQRIRQTYLASSLRICGESEHRGKEYCR